MLPPAAAPDAPLPNLGAGTGIIACVVQQTIDDPRLRHDTPRAGEDAGTEGNDILTRSVAAVLTVLLLAEGVTILQMDGLLSAHMVIGLVLIPPVLVKLGSTGYRMARYYTGARPYRAKGPPALPLRMLAPALVLATVLVFASGVWLMLLGHRSDQVLLLHKASFIVWGAVFGVHFLAYAPSVLRSLRADWGEARRHAVPGAGARAMVIAAALGGGVALALAVLPHITGFHGGDGGG